MNTNERKARRLLHLPACFCGQGLQCPQITINAIDHPQEPEVLKLIRAATPKKKTKKKSRRKV